MLGYKLIELIFKVSDRDWNNLNKVNKALGCSDLSETMKYLIDDYTLLFDMSNIKNDLISEEIINEGEAYHDNISIKLSNKQLDELLRLKDFFKAEDESEVLRFLINNNVFVDCY